MTPSFAQCRPSASSQPATAAGRRESWSCPLLRALGEHGVCHAVAVIGDARIRPRPVADGLVLQRSQLLRREVVAQGHADVAAIRRVAMRKCLPAIFLVHYLLPVGAL